MGNFKKILEMPLSEFGTLSNDAREIFIFLGCKNFKDMLKILQACPKNPNLSVNSKRRKNLLKQIKETIEKNGFGTQKISILKDL
jgi:hypothetical protein